MSNADKLKPSPFVASVRPDEPYNPSLHISFGNIFLEYVTSPPLKDEINAITQGCGMPDRADQGWVVFSGGNRRAAVAEITGISSEKLIAGQGFCGVITEIEFKKTEMDIYIGDKEIFMGLNRNSIPALMNRCESLPKSHSITVKDETNTTARIALMGPDSRKMLRSLEIADNQLVHIGDHIDTDIIFEPVKICRNDFAGPHGYDLIIPIKPFNNILAVLCSWAVRLEMNLLPVGWQAVQNVKASTKG